MAGVLLAWVAARGGGEGEGLTEGGRGREGVGRSSSRQPAACVCRQVEQGEAGRRALAVAAEDESAQTQTHAGQWGA